MTTDQTPAPTRRGAREPQTRRQRLTAEDREALREELAKAYREDTATTIRSLADEHDRSFGLVRVLLLEAKVTLRAKIRRSGNKPAAGAK